MVDGDFLVCLIVHSTGNANTMNTHASWNSPYVGNNGEHNVRVYTRYAISEPANYTFTTTTDNQFHGVIVAISDPHPSLAVNAEHYHILTSTAASITNDVTTTADNCMLLFMVSDDTVDAAEVYSWTGSMTERWDLNQSSAALQNAGATEAVTTQQNYSRTATKTGVNRRIFGALLAIRPPDAGGGGDPLPMAMDQYRRRRQ